MKDLSEYQCCLVAPLLTEGIKEYHPNGKTEKIYISREAIDECAPMFVGKPFDVDHKGNKGEEFDYKTQIGLIVDCFKNLDGYKLGNKEYPADGIVYNVFSIDNDKLKKYNLSFEDIRKKIENHDVYIGVSSTFTTPNSKIRDGVEGANQVNIIENKDDIVPISATLTIGAEPRFYASRCKNLRCNSMIVDRTKMYNGITDYDERKQIYTLTNYDVNVKIYVSDKLESLLKKLIDEGFNRRDIRDVFNAEGEILTRRPIDVLTEYLFGAGKTIDDFYNLISRLAIYDNIRRICRDNLNSDDRAKLKTTTKLKESFDKISEYDYLLDDINDEINEPKKRDIGKVIDEIKTSVNSAHRTEKKLLCAFLMKKEHNLQRMDELRML